LAPAAIRRSNQASARPIRFNHGANPTKAEANGRKRKRFYLLSLGFIHFSESGLFKGLRPIQMEKNPPSPQGCRDIASARCIVSLPPLGLSEAPLCGAHRHVALSGVQARITRSSDSGKKLNRKNRSVSILLWTTAHARSSRNGAVGTLDRTLLLFCGIGIVSTFSHFIERFLTGPLAKAVSSAG
jgi:hypothetical protein